ncbi:hypothetical protein [Thiorhodococcus minor]|uniref:Histidine kinase n=1 Tax=Thiorhodococcus minor TaxID=57489 RepID=A0A6M0K4J4_9GAMM|nr:hypothetical protein [Thiorhodococcus minor]NEV64706.1 hypothetical protein [Thiorhodococcus minor]
MLWARPSFQAQGDRPVAPEGGQAAQSTSAGMDFGGLRSRSSTLRIYIVYNLMSGVLGGSVAVSSQVGEGATFTMRLPRQAPVQGGTDRGSVPVGPDPRVGRQT